MNFFKSFCNNPQCRCNELVKYDHIPHCYIFLDIYYQATGPSLKSCAFGKKVLIFHYHSWVSNLNLEKGSAVLLALWSVTDHMSNESTEIGIGKQYKQIGIMVDTIGRCLII